MPNRRTVCLGGLLAVGGADAQAQSALRFAVSQSWGPPFLERIGARVAGGILPDLMTGIAAELGRRPEFVLLPPARVDTALRDAEVDLHCLLAPSWAPEVRDATRWSVPVLRLRDVLVAAAAGPGTLAEVQAQPGWLVGSVRGYRYPTVEAEFAQGRWRRDDALDQWAVLEKLARGRSPLGIVNEFTLAAYVQRHPGAGLRALQEIDEVQTHCLLAQSPAVAPELIREAIRRFVQNGRMQTVLEPYLPTQDGRHRGERR